MSDAEEEIKDGAVEPIMDEASATPEPEPENKKIKTEKVKKSREEIELAKKLRSLEKQFLKVRTGADKTSNLHKKRELLMESLRILWSDRQLYTLDAEAEVQAALKQVIEAINNANAEINELVKNIDNSIGDLDFVKANEQLKILATNIKVSGLEYHFPELERLKQKNKTNQKINVSISKIKSNYNDQKLAKIAEQVENLWLAIEELNLNSLGASSKTLEDIRVYRTELQEKLKNANLPEISVKPNKSKLKEFNKYIKGLIKTWDVNKKKVMLTNARAIVNIYKQLVPPKAVDELDGHTLYFEIKQKQIADDAEDYIKKATELNEELNFSDANFLLRASMPNMNLYNSYEALHNLWKMITICEINWSQIGRAHV